VWWDEPERGLGCQNLQVNHEKGEGDDEEESEELVAARSRTQSSELGDRAKQKRREKEAIYDRCSQGTSPELFAAGKTKGVAKTLNNPSY